MATKVAITLRPHQATVLEVLKTTAKGTVVAPVGSGKTMIMAQDARRFFAPGSVVTVVAPQLLLASQLFGDFDKLNSDIDFNHCMIGTFDQIARAPKKGRVASGPMPTTRVEDIVQAAEIAKEKGRPLLYVSTYHSLERLIMSGVKVDACYYDEAHNAVRSDFFPAVEAMSAHATHNYFFTATPKVTESGSNVTRGMNNEAVYGKRVYTVPFKDMVDAGYIVNPVVHRLYTDVSNNDASSLKINITSISAVIDAHESRSLSIEPKILFNCKGTKDIQELLDSAFLNTLYAGGYSVLAIDSINKGFINGETGISKANFIKRLHEIGADPSKKMIVLHVEMLGEGISINAFNEIVFLREAMSNTFAYQSVGRVLRCAPGKTVGIVTVIEYANQDEEVRQQLLALLGELFAAGVPADQILREMSGRGDEPLTVEDLDDDHPLSNKSLEADWLSKDIIVKGQVVDFMDCDF